MCYECRRNPCHPSCPNADEPPVIANCDVCHTDLREGESAFQYGDIVMCDDCVRDNFKELRREE